MEFRSTSVHTLPLPSTLPFLLDLSLSRHAPTLFPVLPSIPSPPLDRHGCTACTPCIVSGTNISTRQNQKAILLMRMAQLAMMATKKTHSGSTTGLPLAATPTSEHENTQGTYR